jgi:hypothetical protein
MEHIPTTETYVQKVIRIAKELEISIDKAAVTCDGFELALSDPGSRAAIFGMIERLDESAAKRGEPAGLIVNYGVEVGMGGIHVSRYADEAAYGAVVELTPSDQACIFLRINDDFPTQEVLGPMIVNKPRSMSEPRAAAAGAFSSEEFPAPKDGLTGRDITKSEIPTELPSEWRDAPICLGPIRLKWAERFPFLSRLAPRSPLTTGAKFRLLPADFTALNWPRHPAPWAALPAGMLAFQSGLSRPLPAENLGHSDRKMFRQHWQ